MRQCYPELNLEEGDFLTELVCEKELLQQNTEEQFSLELTLEGLNHTVSAIFHFDTYNSLTPNWYYKVLR